MPVKKKLLWFLFKLLLSAGLIVFILATKASLGGIWRAFESVNPWWLLLAVSLHVPGNLISVVRWRILARVQGDHHRFGYLLQSYLVSQFFNNFLPTRFGGDVVRIWDGSRPSKSLVKSSAIVVVDRVTGLIALFLFALFASLFRLDFAQKLPVIWVSLIVGSIGLLAIVVFFLPLTGRFIERFPARGLADKVRRKVLSFREVLVNYKHHRGPFAGAMVWAVVLQVNVVVYYFLMGKAFHLAIPLWDYFIFIPIVLLIQTIPISLGGLGPRELAYVSIFAAYLISASRAVSYSLVADVAVNLFIGLIGGILYVSRK
jgi:uncharacterized protein (TIRG00374 family)